MILAIDPGERESALVQWDGERVIAADIMDNETLAYELTLMGQGCPLVLEWLTGYGMTVGQSVFETCRWIGIFQESYGRDRTHLLPRREVKRHLCGNVTAKDSHVREALVDRIGPVGTKRQPGPLYGVTSHKVSALAVAVVWHDLNGGGK